MRTIMGYVAGYTLSEIAWYGDPDAALADGAQPAESADARRIVVECDTEAQFTFGLQVLLDGLEVRRGDAR